MYKEADLPLNDRGAVYHLDLLPEEIADTIITVGDPARVNEVSKHFDSIDVVRSHREFLTHTGFFNGKPMSVLSTGIGLPNIDIVINELDALANIDLKTRMPKEKHRSFKIIRLGTTGGLQEAVQPGDIIVSRYAVGFDTLLTYYQQAPSPSLINLNSSLKHFLGENSGPFYVTESDNLLFELLKPIGAPGITATCCGFYAPQGRALRLPIAYPGLIDNLVDFEFDGLPFTNLEMETAGILGLGKIFNHQCASASVVLANRYNGTFSGQVGRHVEQLFQKALELF
jgi:uridine phosphorylase